MWKEQRNNCILKLPMLAASISNKGMCLDGKPYLKARSGIRTHPRFSSSMESFYMQALQLCS